MSDTYTLMPFTDVPDSAPEYGMEGIEARFARTHLGLETIGLSHQKLQPNREAPFAHKHEADEEVYVILSGGGEAIVDGDTMELSPMTVLRCAPTAVRRFNSGPDGLEFLAFGTHTEGDGEIVK